MYPEKRGRKKRLNEILNGVQDMRQSEDEGDYIGAVYFLVFQ